MLDVQRRLGRRSPAVQASGERRLPRRGRASAPLLNPRRDCLRVSPGLAAQHRSLPLERLVQLSLGRAFQDPGHLGQQVGTAARELAQRRDRGGFLVFGQLTPLS